MGAPLSPALYLVATTLLLPGTILLLGDSEANGYAIDFLIAACSLLTLAAFHDLHSAVRGRAALTVPICMLIGGGCFLGGSALYWPRWAGQPVRAAPGWTVGRIGTWVFRTGTVAYLTGSALSLAPLLRAGARGRVARLNVAGVVSYIVGALLYLAGGIVSEAGFTVPGAKLWVAGSGWFVLGALCFVLAASPTAAGAGAADEAAASLIVRHGRAGTMTHADGGARLDRRMPSNNADRTT